MSIVFTFFGYILAVGTHLLVLSGPIRQEELKKVYCTSHEQSCVCPGDSYGVYKQGFPFNSGNTIKYPCGATSALEQRTLEDVADDDKLGFWINTLFWALVSYGMYRGLRAVKAKKV